MDTADNTGIRRYENWVALHEDWEDCRRCELGTQRDAIGGTTVPPLEYPAGHGTRGIMFIGEGPSEGDVTEQAPFSTGPGQILQSIVAKLQLPRYYMTNAVACRACSPVTDEAGVQRTRRGVPLFRDERPLPSQLEKCRPRLEEEIYLMDPVVIVALGGTAAEALLHHPVSITKIRGVPEECTVRGRTFRAVLTDKRNAWLRKSGGQLHAPTEPNEVRYLVVPTLHPAFVARQLADRGPKSAFRLLAQDILLAKKIYAKYQLETAGEQIPVEETSYDQATDDIDDLDI